MNYTNGMSNKIYTFENIEFRKLTIIEQFSHSHFRKKTPFIREFE